MIKLKSDGGDVTARVGVVGEVESVTAASHHLLVGLVEEGGHLQLAGGEGPGLRPAPVILADGLGGNHVSCFVPPRRAA